MPSWAELKCWTQSFGKHLPKSYCAPDTLGALGSCSQEYEVLKWR